MVIIIILQHVRSKPELWIQKRRQLLGNSSINTLPQQSNNMIAATYTHATTEELFRAVFYIRCVPRLYKEK
jgi:hypothetical protein